MPDASSADRDPIEKLAEEFLQRRRNGEAPALSEYAQRYPDLADEIRAVFPALLIMERADPGTSDLARGNGDSAQPNGMPEQLGDFRILREVGRGGMGVVYEAEQVSLGRRVALKVLPPQALADARYLGRFEREAKAAARLHHTNIVPVYGVGADHGIHYYAMQFIHGQPLNEVLEELKRLPGEKVVTPLPQAVRVDAAPVAVAEVARSLLTGPAAPPTVDHVTAADGDRAAGSTAGASGTLPGASGSASARRAYWQSVARVGLQAAEALAYAHGEGILHRDIKPSNLLLDARGHVWVADFGLAKTAESEDLTTTGDIVGTVRYMAPERFAGQTDARSDVYAVGITLYELAALAPAFPESDRHKLIKQVTSEEPAHLRYAAPGMPRDLRTIIHKAMDKEPARRYGTAAALAADLQRFLEDRPIQARPPGRVELFGRWCRRNPVVVGLLSLVLLVLVGGITGIVMQWREAVESSVKADQSAQVADQRRADIEKINDELRRSREQLRRTLYTSDVRLLPAAWQQESMGPMLDLLQRQVPRDGELDLRNFEWHYWNRLCHPEVEAPLEIVKADLPWLVGTALPFNADGSLLAGYASARGFQLWDTRTGKVRTALKPAAPARPGQNWQMTHLALSPDGTRLAAGGNFLEQGKVVHQDLTLWDFATGRRQWHNLKMESPGEPEPSAPRVTGLLNGGRLVFDGEGARLAACVVAKDKAFIRVWDAATGKMRRDLGGYDSPIASFDGMLAFSPDGQRLLALVRGGKRPAAASWRLAVWDTATGKELASIVGPADNARPIAFAFSQQRGRLAAVWQVAAPPASGLATTSAVWLHDAATGKPLSLFPMDADDGPIGSVQFSPAGESLLTLSNRGTVHVWDTGTHHLLRRLPNPLGKMRAIGFAGEERVLTLETDWVIKGWDIATRPRVLPLTRVGMVPYNEPHLSADGKRVAVVSGVHPGADPRSNPGGALAMQVRDTETGRVLFTRMVNSDSGADIAFSADGKRVAVCDRNRSGKELLPIVVLEVDTGKQCASFVHAAKDGSRFHTLSLSADGSRIASFAVPLLVGQPGSLAVWDISSGAALLQQETSFSSAYHLGFSPDGKRIAFALTAYVHTPQFQVKSELHVRDVASGKDLWTRHGNGGYAFSPDGRRLAITLAEVGDHQGTLVVDAATGAVQLRLEGEDDQSNRVAFGPDGQRILTVGRAARLWDARTGDQLLILERARTADNAPTINAAPRAMSLLLGRYQFSDDGRRLLAAHFRAATDPKFYELVIRSWDATPLHDLRDVLAGRVQPASNRERFRLIALCKWQRRYVAAARFYRDAFAADPSLTDDVMAGHRYDAACCELWAAAGQAADGDSLDAPARARMRQQALAWLQADLEGWQKRLDGDGWRDRDMAVETLRRWQSGADLAAIRQPDAIAQLPADAQQACRQLWAGVAVVLEADEHYQRASRLEAAKQWPAAIAEYRQAIANNLAGRQIHARLADALEANNDWAGAAAAYRKIVALEPSVENYARLDVALQVAKQPAEALAAYRKVLAIDAARAALFYRQYGINLRAVQRLDAAIAALRRSVEAAPKDQQGYFSLGLALFAKQEWDESIAVFRQQTAIAPRSSIAYFYIGLCMERKRQWDDAIAAYHHALDIDPKHAQSHNALGFALSQKGDVDGAIAEYRAAIAINSGMPNVHYNLGMALRSKGDLPAAVAEYRRAILIAPNFAAAHDQLGWTLRLQGKLEEALPACRMAVKLEPGVASFQNSLGCVLRDLGKTADAIAAFRQAIVVDARHAPAHGNLGIALGDAGDWNGAIAAYRKAIHLDAAHRDALFNLPEALLRRDRLAEAQKVAQQAVIALGKDAEAVRRAALYDRLAALQPRIADLLADRMQAANNAERLDLALLCRLQKRYATAVRLYAEAFAAEPGLAGERTMWHRYNAACYAALAGTGHGIDTAKEDDERARLRRQALDWLRAEFALWQKLKANGTAPDRQQLRHWQRDPDFNGMRGPAIDRLPVAEQAPWRQLWADVAQLLKESPATHK